MLLRQEDGSSCTTMRLLLTVPPWRSKPNSSGSPRTSSCEGDLGICVLQSSRGSDSHSLSCQRTNWLHSRVKARRPRRRRNRCSSPPRRRCQIIWHRRRTIAAGRRSHRRRARCIAGVRAPALQTVPAAVRRLAHVPLRAARLRPHGPVRDADVGAGHGVGTHDADGATGCAGGFGALPVLGGG